MTQFVQLPVTKLVADRVPADQRRWVEESIIGPVNRVLPALAAILRRLMLAQVNVQLLEHKGLPPSTASPVEFGSELTGSCQGLIPVYARTLDAGGTLGAPVGGLVLPVWTEVALTDRAGSRLRITAQTGLTDGTKYVVKWLALGA